MSHFSVMVIGDDVEGQLAPYHEFECTGNDDQYVVDVDKTQEARKEYEEATERRYVDPYGEMFDPYEDQFYREPTKEELDKIGPLAGSGFCGGLSYFSKDWEDGQGYRPKIHFLPEGWTEKALSADTQVDFAQWAASYYGLKIVEEGQPIYKGDAHKYGHVLVKKMPKRAMSLDGKAHGPEVIKVVDRTNPNKQWDWWVVGGRWSNFLLKKDGTRCDSAPISWIDIDGMREHERATALRSWDKAKAILAGRPFATWKETLDKHAGNIDAARAEYHDQQVIKDWNASREFGFFDKPQDFLVPREQFGEAAANRALSTYAVVKDGQWYSKGKMGWWGMSDDKLEQEDWNKRVAELIAGLDESTSITIVDCHI